ncbi:hypothetical protein FNF27_03313 [Cafeteria roenbergensis]|uniref:Uncharacterized protein n=1 Tax=Cafeteria roenbergensis TaxID=33653 RepID=A0A5A8EBU3_CAFRO|nr:hypothetical protein FNF27_03313 [Cafeteria roenbergensis]
MAAALAPGVDAAVAALHALCRKSGRRACLVAAGAGQSLHSRLLDVPGASATVLSAHVPYAREEFLAFLGAHADAGPASFCSAEAADLLADAARRRAVDMVLRQSAGAGRADEDHPPGELVRLATGVACSATLATSREHKGELRAFGCVMDGVHTWRMRVQLAKTGDAALGRAAQERAAADAWSHWRISPT